MKTYASSSSSFENCSSTAMRLVGLLWLVTCLSLTTATGPGLPEACHDMCQYMPLDISNPGQCQQLCITCINVDREWDGTNASQVSALQSQCLCNILLLDDQSLMELSMGECMSHTETMYTEFCAQQPDSMFCPGNRRRRLLLQKTGLRGGQN